MSKNYSKIKKKYIKLGIRKGQSLYITADFGKIISKRLLSKKILDLHFNAINEIIGKNGTIIVPTATLNLCNTKKIFDPNLTQSFNMGVFSEFVRKKEKAKRSFHALWSVSAIGRLASYFTKNISKHAFGYDSIWTRLINKNALSLHIGVDPRKSISIVHYTELMAGVPYRYTKSFNNLVKKNNKIVKTTFFHFCVIDEKKIIRDGNIKIFKNFKNKYKIKKINFDNGKVILFPLKKFYEINLKFLKDNPYAWTRKVLN
tara:strand:+ start:303 stop:1079 length:777 start_codon:yes stop_codon:yes gene_type:complete